MGLKHRPPRCNGHSSYNARLAQKSLGITNMAESTLSREMYNRDLPLGAHITLLKSVRIELLDGVRPRFCHVVL